MLRLQSAAKPVRVPHLTRNPRNLCLALAIAFSVAGTCLSQTVTIRLVDLRSKRPLQGKHIYVFGIKREASKEEGVRRELGRPLNADLSLVTDIKGEAAFELPKPAPSYFYVRAALSGIHWDCFCAPRVSTKELEQKGIVVKNAEKKTGVILPKPTEILFALRPTPWWVRLFWPILKG